MDRRHFLATFAAAGAFASLPQHNVNAQGSGYPTKPIKVIVPFPAGGAVDATIRLIAPNLATALGQPVVIENKPGANGGIGAAAVANSEADSHTLLFAPREVYGINPVISRSLPYDPVNGLEPISIVAEAAYVLIANPALGVKSVKDLIALAGTRELNYASFGPGSMGHLNLEAFAREAKIRLNHIPYRGAPQAVQAVVAGEVALAISTAPAALGLIQEGKLVALAAGAPKRLELLPDVPTLAEAGIAQEVLIPVYFGLAGPKGLPKEISERLSNEIRALLSDATIAERFRKLGLVPTGSTPDHMRQAVADDIRRFGAIVQAIGLKIE